MSAGAWPLCERCGQKGHLADYCWSLAPIPPLPTRPPHGSWSQSTIGCPPPMGQSSIRKGCSQTRCYAQQRAGDGGFCFVLWGDWVLRGAEWKPYWIWSEVGYLNWSNGTHTYIYIYTYIYIIYIDAWRGLTKPFDCKNIHVQNTHCMYVSTYIHICIYTP